MTQSPPQTQATPDAPRAWLDQLPASHRSAIANWFHYSVRSGITVPAAVLVAVEATVQRRLAWRRPADEPWLREVLARLAEDRAGAMAYAEHVIAYEALPHDARRRLKAERTFAALRDGMKGKAVTEPQRAYLRALGYVEAPPADRAAASLLIDQLKRDKGVA